MLENAFIVYKADRSLESIQDNYEKTILTMDININKDYNGIKVKNIIDFLLED